MQDAPLFNELAEGPAGGNAYWIHAGDGVRLRVGYWPGGDKGTVLLFPGRSEYIEKYGRSAHDLRARGYGTLVIDWRGHGLADRLDDDPVLGHVGQFSDYQLDVAAMIDAAEKLDCPRPWFLLTHSMGGAIGLRALHNALPVNAAVFSAPMWGVSIAAHLRPFAWVLSWATHKHKLGRNYAPGTKAASYVLMAPHEDNFLTTDADMYAYMQNHMRQKDELIIGGPSLTWLYEALRETRKLRAMPPPDVPTIAFLGTNERVVVPGVIHRLMAKWKTGRLHMFDGAEHEVLMEAPATRAAFFDAADALFTENGPAG